MTRRLYFEADGEAIKGAIHDPVSISFFPGVVGVLCTHGHGHGFTGAFFILLLSKIPYANDGVYRPSSLLFIVRTRLIIVVDHPVA